MADPNQTPGPERFHWACPCAGCSKSVKYEREQLIYLINEHKKEYLEYRGSSFDKKGNLLWAKDDAMAYVEGLDKVVLLITERMPKPKVRK
jgi:hypothetical protein